MRLLESVSGQGKPVRMVNHVSRSLEKGSVLVLLGGSGSGKSVTLQSLLRVHPKKTSQVEGRILVDGQSAGRPSSRWRRASIASAMSLNTRAWASPRSRSTMSADSEALVWWLCP